jgi:rare lipoprotein A
VRVNDRGPFGQRKRVLDLSRAAAEALDMIRAGVVRVRIEVISRQ